MSGFIGGDGGSGERPPAEGLIDEENREVYDMNFGDVSSENDGVAAEMQSQNDKEEERSAEANKETTDEINTLEVVKTDKDINNEEGVPNWKDDELEEEDGVAIPGDDQENGEGSPKNGGDVVAENPLLSPVLKSKTEKDTWKKSLDVIEGEELRINANKETTDEINTLEVVKPDKDINNEEGVPNWKDDELEEEDGVALPGDDQENGEGSPKNGGDVVAENPLLSPVLKSKTEKDTWKKSLDVIEGEELRINANKETTDEINTLEVVKPDKDINNEEGVPNWKDDELEEEDGVAIPGDDQENGEGSPKNGGDVVAENPLLSPVLKSKTEKDTWKKSLDVIEGEELRINGSEMTCHMNNEQEMPNWCEDGFEEEEAIGNLPGNGELNHGSSEKEDEDCGTIPLLSPVNLENEANGALSDPETTQPQNSEIMSPYEGYIMIQHVITDILTHVEKDLANLLHVLNLHLHQILADDHPEILEPETGEVIGSKMTCHMNNEQEMPNWYEDGFEEEGAIGNLPGNGDFFHGSSEKEDEDCGTIPLLSPVNLENEAIGALSDPETTQPQNSEIMSPYEGLVLIHNIICNILTHVQSELTNLVLMLNLHLHQILADDHSEILEPETGEGVFREVDPVWLSNQGLELNEATVEEMEDIFEDMLTEIEEEDFYE